MNYKKYAEWVQNRPPVNPIFADMLVAMTRAGDLEGLSGDEVLLAVSAATRSFVREILDEEEYFKQQYKRH